MLSEATNEVQRCALGARESATALITARPDATLSGSGARCQIGRAQHTLADDRSVGATVKNRTLRRQRRPDVMAARQSWRDWLPLPMCATSVFLDECGTTDLLRATGAAPRRAPARSHALWSLADPR
jgi:hypothetical protein